MKQTFRIFKQSIILAMFLPFVFVACGGTEPAPELTPSTTPSRTSSPYPTRTPSMTPSLTSTPVVIPNAYTLPDWMADPQTVILVTLLLEEYETPKLSFINAATRDQYVIPIPAETRNHFWYDNMHFGFLSDDLQSMYLINFATGQVSTSLVSQESTVYLTDNPNDLYALQVIKDPFSGEVTLFEYADKWKQHNISSNHHYSFSENWEQTEEGQVIVTDLRTGNVIWATDPTDGYFDTVMEWSPVNEAYLAIVQGKIDENNDFQFPVKNTTLSVYNVRTGETITTLRGDIGRLVWSPDGTKILYENALHLYWNFGYGFTDAPCILDIVTGENRCLSSIPNSHIPDGFSLQTTDNYQWSAYGQLVYYVSSFGSTTQTAGNICIFTLLDGSIYCPTANLSNLPGWNANWLIRENEWSIRAYDFSPDAQYIHFCVSSNSPLSDDQGGPSQDGLIDIKGTQVTLWAEQLLDGIQKCSWGGSWRPLP